MEGGPYPLGCVVFPSCLFLLGEERHDGFFSLLSRGKRIGKGETLYRISDGHLQYKYSPASAVFFALLALLPEEAAKLIWYFVQIFLFYLSLHLSYELLPQKWRKKGTTLLLTFLVMLKFFAREVELGQVNILIIFLFVITFISLLKEKEAEAGISLGFSLFFKPYALVFLPYLLLKKKLKVILAGTGMIVLGFFLPMAFYGFKGNIAIFREWQESLSVSTMALLKSYDNASLHAFFLKIFPPQTSRLVWLWILVWATVIGFSFLWMTARGRRNKLKKPEILEYSFLLVLIPLFSPLGWYYNYLYSFLAVIVLLNLLGKFPAGLRFFLITNFIIIGASLMEVMGKPAFHFYTGYSLVVINYLIILFFLLYSRKRELS